MRRLLLCLALASALPFAEPAAAAPSTIRDAHRHHGELFRIRFEPAMSIEFTYRVFHADPSDPASLLVERSNTWLGEESFVDLNLAGCPALREAVAALARMEMPAITLGDNRHYDYRAPRPQIYEFDGFVRFANGAEGEISFTSYDVRGRPADPQLEWMRRLVRAFDACRPRPDLHY
ncbi:MAG TPA: hypothetical protein VEC11_12585 [Allosphingosinicella sp.]|nr:hypothetical protein [Allosphingosinicella sp.]